MNGGSYYVCCTTCTATFTTSLSDSFGMTAPTLERMRDAGWKMPIRFGEDSVSVYCPDCVAKGLHKGVKQ